MSDSLLDNLLGDSQTNYLKEKCPALFDDSGTPNFSYNNILSTDQTLIIPDGLKYYQMVENGNNYVNDLLSEEEKYLKQKYGESLYNYFVTKREEYINNKMKSVCSTIISQDGGSTDVGDSSDGKIADTLIVALRQQLNSYEQSLRTYNEVNKNNKKINENKYLNARKFYYQSDAMSDVDNIDTAMTAFYYVVLITSILYLTIKGRVELKKNWLIYLLFFILPLILSKLYAFFIIRFLEMRDQVSEIIPKKAFLNQK